MSAAGRASRRAAAGRRRTCGSAVGHGQKPGEMRWLRPRQCGAQQASHGSSSHGGGSGSGGNSCGGSSSGGQVWQAGPHSEPYSRPPSDTMGAAARKRRRGGSATQRRWQNLHRGGGEAAGLLGARPRRRACAGRSIPGGASMHAGRPAAATPDPSARLGSAAASSTTSGSGLVGLTAIRPAASLGLHGRTAGGGGQAGAGAQPQHSLQLGTLQTGRTPQHLLRRSCGLPAASCTLPAAPAAHSRKAQAEPSPSASREGASVCSTRPCSSRHTKARGTPSEVRSRLRV